MAYQALYRKYRPSSLEDVIGQDIVIKILKNAIINDKIGHAYLFSGPRGIGKTSIAKIYAKTVNCLNPKDGIACGECDNCKILDSGFCPDIIEIDAASNNGVDEIREIKNKINLVPNQLKYKVYIIDEVHMLSIGAFNALLKTLEEPPEHIIFILATTDPQKVPITVVSRCQCFDFHRIPNNLIVERLKFICGKENISCDDCVLEKIAELSDGGLRDSIGMLDKINAYSNSNVTLEDFEKINGIVSSDKIEKFIFNVKNSDLTEIIKFIDDIYDNGKDLMIFVQDLLKNCKDRIIKYYVDNTSDDIDFLLLFSQELNLLLKNIKMNSNIKTLIEISLLSFVNKNIPSSKNEIESSKNGTLEKKKNDSFNDTDTIVKKSNDVINSTVEEEKNTVDYQKNNKNIINNCFARANKEFKQMFEQKWKNLNDYALDSVYGATAGFLTDGIVRVVGEGEVLISFEYESMVDRGFNLMEKVQKLFEKVYNIKYDVAFVTNQEWDSIKKEFVENKNNGISYKYIPIDENVILKNSDDDSITSQAIELFGEDVISVN